MYVIMSMDCRTNGLSNQWVVGPMDCRTNGLSDQREVREQSMIFFDIVFSFDKIQVWMIFVCLNISSVQKNMIDI